MIISTHLILHIVLLICFVVVTFWWNGFLSVKPDLEDKWLKVYVQLCFSVLFILGSLSWNP